MRLSEQQFLKMLSIVKSTLRIASEFDYYTREQRHKLVNEILAQQNDELVELNAKVENQQGEVVDENDDGLFHIKDVKRIDDRR